MRYSLLQRKQRDRWRVWRSPIQGRMSLSRNGGCPGGHGGRSPCMEAPPLSSLGGADTTAFSEFLRQQSPCLYNCKSGHLCPGPGQRWPLHEEFPCGSRPLPKKSVFWSQLCRNGCLRQGDCALAQQQHHGHPLRCVCCQGSDTSGPRLIWTMARLACAKEGFSSLLSASGAVLALFGETEMQKGLPFLVTP